MLQYEDENIDDLKDNNELYHYDLETVDMIAKQILNGDEPSFTTPELDIDVQRRIRYYKRLSGIEDDDDNDTDLILDEDQIELVKIKAEQEKRKARQTDVMIIKLSDEIKDKIRKDMETSIVRPDPNLSYHKSDDELNIDTKRKSVLKKLSRVRKCYYNQKDYQNAINIIKEAILYDLETSYTWIGKKEAIRMFNEGQIKFKGCVIPKLYLNYSTEVTDPELLSGVVTGEVIIKDKNESKPKPRPKTKSEPVDYDYSIIPKHYVDTFTEMHRKGFNTPISAMLENTKGIFNRFGSDIGGYLFGNNNAIKRLTNPELADFDWLQPDAANKYVKLINGKKTTLEEICEKINEQNNGMIQDHVLSNMRKFEIAINKSNGIDLEKENGFSPTIIDKQVIDLENKIMNSIKAYNPINNNMR